MPAASSRHIEPLLPASTVQNTLTLTTSTQAQSITILRQAGKVLTPTNASTASMLRSLSKSLSATQGQLASFVRQPRTSLYATNAQTASVVVANIILRTLSATASASPALMRQVGVLRSVTQAQSVSALKTLAKLLSANQVQSTNYVSAVTGTSGLMAYYRLNEASGNAASQVNSLTATYNAGTGNAPTYQATGLLTGDTDKAVSFPGSTTAPSYFRQAYDATYFANTALSIECWIKPSATTPFALLVGRSNPNIVAFIETTTANIVRFYVRDSNTSDITVESSISLSAGTAYHVVAVYDHTVPAMKVYINGVDRSNNLSRTPNAAIRTNATGSGPTIGSDGGATSSQFPGVIDEVAWYNRLLTSTEASDHYALGIAAAGGQTVVSTMAKRANATRSATQGETSTFTSRTGATRSATQSETSTFTRQVGATRSAAQSSDPTLTRQAQLIKAVTQAASAALTASRSAINYAIELATSSAAGASIAKLISAMRSATVAQSVSHLRTTGATRSATQAQSGSLAKKSIVSKAASQAQVATLSSIRVLLRTLSTSAGASASLVRRVSSILRPGNNTGTLSTTRAVSSTPLSDSVALSHVRSASENIPSNATANHYVPTSGELASFHSLTSEPYSSLVTGGTTGTTDEIIQWAAWKWGVDEDVLRAVAYQESEWDQDTLGDRRTESLAAYNANPSQAQIPSSVTPTTGDVWQSLGLTQIKWLPEFLGSFTGWNGTEPLRWKSTAFNADFWGRSWRSAYDGQETWLLTEPNSDGSRNEDYAAGDLWGCVGFWFSGDWYSTGSQNYIDLVQGHLASQPWAPVTYGSGPGQSSTASNVKRDNATRSATQTQSASFRRFITHLLSPTQAATATISAIKAFLMTLSATQGQSASTLKRTTRILTSTVSTSPTFVRQISTRLSATVTALATKTASVLANQYTIALTATQASLASVARRVTATRTATQAQDVSLPRRVATSITAVPTLVASLLKNVRTTREGTQSSQTVLSRTSNVVRSAVQGSTASFTTSFVRLLSLVTSATSSASLQRFLSVTKAAGQNATASKPVSVARTLATTVTSIASVLRETVIEGLVGKITHRVGKGARHAPRTQRFSSRRRSG